MKDLIERMIAIDENFDIGGDKILCHSIFHLDYTLVNIDPRKIMETCACWVIIFQCSFDFTICYVI